MAGGRSAQLTSAELVKVLEAVKAIYRRAGLRGKEALSAHPITG